MKQNKKPFAFISYSRSDKDVAIDLIKRIESYAYPVEWVSMENRPDNEKYVRPIFLDLTDLSAQTRNFSEELRERLAEARYLIVICTEHSANSGFVHKEIDYFLSTHDNNADLICAVYVDKIFNGMHPVIDEIVASRNCPIYVTDEGDAGQTGRKYCLHHILEFLLKVEFSKLYNRYEDYLRSKKKRRMMMMAMVLAFLFGFLLWGLIAEHRRAISEKEKAQIAEEHAQTEHERVIFERGIFPYSLVVGYVNNFLAPTMKALNDSLPDRLPHMFIYMPSDSTDLIDSVRVGKFTRFLQHNYPFEGYSTEHLTIPNRFRGASISRMKFANSNIPIYKDDARTVVAFKYVIDYKLSPLNPVEITIDEPQNFFTRLYTDSFIVDTRRLLPEYDTQLHFVKDTIELRKILNGLFIAEQEDAP